MLKRLSHFVVLYSFARSVVENIVLRQISKADIKRRAYLINQFITYLRLYQGDKQTNIKMICPGNIISCPASKAKMAYDSKSVVEKQNML